jgi:hypothetical protein
MANKIKKPVRLICKTCGETFEVSPWRAKKAKFCSKKCKNKDVRLKMFKYHRENTSKRIAKVCRNELCKKNFEVKPEMIEQKFCCHKCYVYSKTKKYKEKLIEKAKKDNLKLRNKIWGI